MRDKKEGPPTGKSAAILFGQALHVRRPVWQGTTPVFLAWKLDVNPPRVMRGIEDGGNKTREDRKREEKRRHLCGCLKRRTRILL